MGTPCTQAIFIHPIIFKQKYVYIDPKNISSNLHIAWHKRHLPSPQPPYVSLFPPMWSKNSLFAEMGRKQRGISFATICEDPKFKIHRNEIIKLTKAAKSWDFLLQKVPIRSGHGRSSELPSKRTKGREVALFQGSYWRLKRVYVNSLDPDDTIEALIQDWICLQL